MAKITRKAARQAQRLSRKTKKALITSVGRAQYHDWMAEQAHDTATKAKAEIFARAAEPPYLIQTGKLRRLKAFGNTGSGNK